MRAILTYHSIDATGSVVSIDPLTFRAHVRWLTSGAVPVVSLEELVKLPASADAIALTFDDAFQNFAEIAAPALLENRLPATLFVATDAVGSTNAWKRGGDPDVPQLPLLSWDALGRLRAAGIDLGGHSRSHARLPLLSTAGIEEEVSGSSERLFAELGHRPTAFAYPYGAVDERVAAVVRRQYRLACTTELRALGAFEDRVLLPRLDAYYLRAPGRLESWGSSRFRRHLRLRAAGRRLRLHILSGSGR